MRIARVLTRLNLGGPARQVLASDPELLARGHEVRVFAGSPEAGEGDLHDELAARGVEVVRVPGLRRAISVTGDLRAGRFLRQALAEYAPDVVHTHASKAGVLGRRAALRLEPRPALVHTFHGHVLEGYFPPTLSRALLAAERRLARDTQVVVAVSHATAEDLSRLEVADERRLVVVPPGVDLAPLLACEGRTGVLREQLQAGPDVFLVGVLGRLAEVKQPERALAVFSTLAERYPRLQLVFIGDGEVRGALERAITGGDEALRTRVHMVGARTDLTDILPDLDAVLCTSRSEGLPVALIEAAAAALPVVARDVGGVSEVVAHERTGFVAAEDDELAYFLAQLLDDPAEARAVGHRARLRVPTRHGPEVLAGRLEEVYRVAMEAAP